MENKRLGIAKMNILHQNISLYNLHTILFIFPKVLTRKIGLIMKSFFGS